MPQAEMPRKTRESTPLSQRTKAQGKNEIKNKIKIIKNVLKYQKVQRTRPWKHTINLKTRKVTIATIVQKKGI